MEILQVEVEDRTISVALHRPEADGAETPLRPVVLVIDDLLTPPGNGSSLIDGVTTTLLEAGCAVARCPAPPDQRGLADTAPARVDDASATLRRILLTDGLDGGRVGVAGFGLGAVTAACLAGRTDHLAALLLIAPPVPAGVGARFETGDAELPPFVKSLRDLDPIADVGRHRRPVLIVHGAADKTIPPNDAHLYCAAAGENASVQLVARADHAFTNADDRAICLDCVRSFFAGLVALKVGAVPV